MISDVQDTLFYSVKIPEGKENPSASIPVSGIGFVANNPDYVLMQSTGMTDINGQEIFEGDVINDVHGDGFVVRFGRCVLVTEESELPVICFYHYFVLVMGMEPALVVIAPDCDIEVIGNAYENPDLRNADEIAHLEA